MKRYMATFIIFFVLFGTRNVFAVDPLTLGVVINQAEKSLNSVIDNSLEAGDFLITPERVNLI